MAVLPGFVGPANQLSNFGLDVEDLFNWYLEAAGPGVGKASAGYSPRPGLKPFVVLGDGPVRALFYQDGRAFAVGGANFYEVLASQRLVWRGAVRQDGRPATISSNGSAGNQLFLTSGGFGYIFDLLTNVLSPIADPDFLTPSGGGVFLDGYFVNLHAQSRQFQISDLEDGTSWDALDVSEVSKASDDLTAMAVSHGDLYLFGSKTREVWTDVGDADNPLQPVPGGLSQQGLLAPYSVTELDNTLYYVGTNDAGNNIAYRVTGYSSVERISTHAIEQAWSQFPRVDDAIGWTYQSMGHAFYILYLPSPPTRGAHTHFAYDVATQEWHRLAQWDVVAERWQPHLGRCHAFAFGRYHLIGDRKSPAIYELRDDYGFDGEVVLD
jgi:hypothetical protein